MTELCNNNSLFDFIKIMTSVILGGLITYLTILITEKRKGKQNKTDSKRVIYNKIYSSISSIIRYEIAYLQTDVIMKYHRRICDLENRQGETYILHKEQAFFHQKQQSDYFIKLIDIASSLDQFSVDYHLYFGADDTFDSLLKRICEWDRPIVEDFNNYNDTDSLNAAYQNMMSLMRKIVNDSIRTDLAKLNNHIKSKL